MNSSLDICVSDRLSGEVIAIVEVDGPHHLYPVRWGDGGRDIVMSHATTRRNDIQKDAWALGQGHPMIRLLAASSRCSAARTWVLGLLRSPASPCLHQFPGDAAAYCARDAREAAAATAAMTRGAAADAIELSTAALWGDGGGTDDDDDDDDTGGYDETAAEA